MANGNGWKVFGWQIVKDGEQDTEGENLKSIVPPTDPDAPGYTTGSSRNTWVVDFDDTKDVKDNATLIRKYRGAAMQAECDQAIEDIVTEAIVTEDNNKTVTLDLNQALKEKTITKPIADKVIDEFNNIVHMLKFDATGHDMFRSWYIDGRLYHHLVIDSQNPSAGIQDIRFMDATRVQKIKKVKYKDDPAGTGVKIVDKVIEYYIYHDKSVTQHNTAYKPMSKAIKLAPDSVSYVASGLLDDQRKRVISYLHKALKAVNQLRMMEDSLVIYRLARAPERRIFYVDVGSLSNKKAEQYLRNLQTKYRNKLVYDANTGTMRDKRHQMHMLEDFWLPRREGTRGTQIDTLPGGQNLGQIDDILYFQKKLFRSLNVPLNRLEQEAQFSLGRTSEITRDELKFMKFVDRLRKRFSILFLDILEKQCLIKNICTQADWDSWKKEMRVVFARDNHFTEMKEAEITRERLTTLDQTSPYVGEYVSRDWVMRNVLKLDDEEIELMLDQMEKEAFEKIEMQARLQAYEQEMMPSDEEGGAGGNDEASGTPPDVNSGDDEQKESVEEDDETRELIRAATRFLSEK